MAVLTHAYADLDTANVSNSTTLATRLTLNAAALAAAGFQNNDEVLVLMWGVFASVNAGSEQAWRVQYNGSSITNGTANPQYDFGVTATPTTGPSKHGAFMTRVNLGTLADFTVQNARVGTSANISLEKFRLVVLRLADFGTENVDWFWNQSTTGVAHTTTYSGTNRATITWTPSGVEDWVALATIHVAIDSVSLNAEARTVLDGALSRGDFSHEGESTGEELVWLWADVLTSLAASSHTLTVQSRDDAGTAADDHRQSALFVFRRAIFTDIYFNAPSNANINADTDTQIATITDTLTAEQDLLIMGQSLTIPDDATDPGYAAWMWVEDAGATLTPDTDWNSDTSTTNGAGIKVINTITYDLTDERWAFWMGHQETQSGTLDLDLMLRTWGDSNSNPANQRLLLVWGLKLSGGAASTVPVKDHYYRQQRRRSVNA